jgi:HAD superfamily hydrolase (TIGR01549 family)
VNKIKIISFDVEGTLVTTDFSYAIWFEAIPERYAEKYGLTLDQAKKLVREEYEKIGDQRAEWYDIKYWFAKMDLGDYKPVMEQHHHRVSYFPEVKEVFSHLKNKYKIIASSGSAREFLDHLLRDIEPCFHKIYSSTSDYKQPKTNEFYLEICKNLGVAPEEILHIGDNWEFDCISASEIGIKTVFLDRQKASGRKNSVSSLEELKNHLRTR